MILYTYAGAPNPRRVTIFAAEKGIPLELVNIDLPGGEQKTADFLQRNPSGKIPILELEDGTCIAESVAISRYLEGLKPEPNLFGRTVKETAIIEMYHRFIELELFSQVGVSWVNGPIIAATGMIEPIAAAKARSDAFVKAFYGRLDGQLDQNEYIAGDRFTVADISAFCCIEFAGALVGLKPDDKHEHLWRWHSTIAARDSV